MAGIDRNTGQPIGRQKHIAQAIEVLLTTPRGTRVMQRELGVDFLDEAGHPAPGFAAVRIEAAVHDVLSRYEPRIDLDAVTAHFDGDVLEDIRVAYRDREDASQHEVTVSYLQQG